MKKEITPNSLRKVNIYAGVLHLVQMIGVLLLSNDFTLPINATYMSGPPGTTFAEPVVLFKTPVGLTVAIFLGLSARSLYCGITKVFPKIQRRFISKAKLLPLG